MEGRGAEGAPSAGRCAPGSQVLTQESSRGTVLCSAWKSMSYLVGIGPSARALELMDTSTRAIPPTATPEFRDQYAHARGRPGLRSFPTPLRVRAMRAERPR